MKTITDRINNDGYAVIDNCINKRLLGKINRSIRTKLKKVLRKTPYLQE